MDEQTLRRIVALLFALAHLADRAGSRSFFVRRLVLWILRPAETVARGLVLDARQTFPDLPAPRLSESGDSPAAAMSLGESLRALASILAGLLAHAFRVLPAVLQPRAVLEDPCRLEALWVAAIDILDTS